MARRSILAAVIVVLLAGCRIAMPGTAAEGATQAASGFLAAYGDAPDEDEQRTRKAPSFERGKPPLARADLVYGSVVAAGPGGYCIDPETLGRRASRDFAVVASCHILSGGAIGPVVPPLLVTVTVGPLEDDLVLPDAASLAALSRSELLSEDSGDGMVLAQLSAGGERVFEGSDPRHWRAVFSQNGRLVGLALYAPIGVSPSPAESAALLRAVRSRIGEESASRGGGGGLLGRFLR